VPALRERELLKQHYIAGALIEEFVARGTQRARATALAGVGMVVFQAAYAGWVTDRSRTTLTVRIQKSLADVTADLSSQH
jgi:hypothetical protein